MWWESVHAGAGVRRRSDGVSGPGARWGHSCNVVNGGRLIYVFGGYGSGNCQTNDVHVFDTVNQKWSKPVMNGLPPSPRDSHSCTAVGNRLFVFGGTDGKNPLKDLHILDISSNTWVAPNTHGGGPDAREGHSAVLVGQRIFIFGGCGKSEAHEEKYYNDLYILDTENLTWQCPVTTGTPPSARDSHSCSSWKNKFIVLGGEDSSDCYLSDVHVLDTDTLAWEPIRTSGQIFPPRAGHTTVALGYNLYVFGGFTDARSLYDDLHVLNINSCTWRKVQPMNQGPSGRFSVAGDCLDGKKGILVFIGGCNESLEALDDMYYLHTDTNIRTRKSIGEIRFEARVTSANPYGYAIETIIDGKVLHGMVFSCTSNVVSLDNQAYPNKRVTAGVIGKRHNIDQHASVTNTAVNEVVHEGQSQSPCEEELMPHVSLSGPLGSNMPDVVEYKTDAELEQLAPEESDVA